MAYIEKNFVASGITGDIIGASMEVHRRLGPGFLESVYEEALAVEFEINGIGFKRQYELPVFYKERKIKQFICDFLVDNRIIVEIKAIKQIGEIEKLQVINYLKASSYEIGLLFNFGQKSLEWKRLINTNDFKNQCNPCNQ